MKNVEELLGTRRRELQTIAEQLIEKETLYYRDLVNILEPARTPSDIDRELAELGNRKLVGKQPLLTIDQITGKITTGTSGKGGTGNGGADAGGSANNNQSPRK